MIPGGCLAGNRSADWLSTLRRCFASEQGARPDTAHRSIKLRLTGTAHTTGKFNDSQWIHGFHETKFAQVG